MVLYKTFKNAFNIYGQCASLSRFLSRVCRRRLSTSGRRFPALEHSAAENVTSAPSLDVFWIRLQTHLFSRSFIRPFLQCPRSDFVFLDTSTFLIFLFKLCDVGRVVVTDCFKLEVYFFTFFLQILRGECLLHWLGGIDASTPSVR